MPHGRPSKRPKVTVLPCSQWCMLVVPGIHRPWRARGHTEGSRTLSRCQRRASLRCTRIRHTPRYTHHPLPLLLPAFHRGFTGLFSGFTGFSAVLPVFSVDFTSFLVDFTSFSVDLPLFSVLFSGFTVIFVLFGGFPSFLVDFRPFWWISVLFGGFTAVCVLPWIYCRFAIHPVVNLPFFCHTSGGKSAVFAAKPVDLPRFCRQNSGYTGISDKTVGTPAFPIKRWVHPHPCTRDTKSIVSEA